MIKYEDEDVDALIEICREMSQVLGIIAMESWQHTYLEAHKLTDREDIEFRDGRPSIKRLNDAINAVLGV